MAYETMTEMLPGLFKTSHEYPFWIFDRYKTSAYLLVRPQGNVVIYASKNLSQHATQIDDLGGAQDQMLTHVHEATSSTERERARLELRLHVPQNSVDGVEKKCTVHAVLEESLAEFPDIEHISTPGHTVGSSCLLWTSGGRKILFTGDNFYTGKKDLWSVYIKSSASAQVVESLLKIREIDADFIVPAGCYNEIAVWPMTRNIWEEAIDRCIERVQNGAKR